MASTDGDEEKSTGSSCIVVFPNKNSSREGKTIFRLKVALELVVLALFVVTMLFVWQLTENGKRSEVRVNINGINWRDITCHNLL